MIKIDSERLSFLLEGRKSKNGDIYYLLTIGAFRVKLKSLDSVSDILLNNAVGYVQPDVKPLNETEK